MYKIVKKQELTTNIYLMEVEADRVAKTCEPGQFVIVRMDSESERIPLTICDYNREKGTVTIVFQTVGAGTKLMAQLSAGGPASVSPPAVPIRADRRPLRACWACRSSTPRP